MDPSSASSSASPFHGHRIPPPKDVDPPRQRIDVAVCPLSAMRANAHSVSVVADAKSNVPAGRRSSSAVSAASKPTIPANSSTGLRPSSCPRISPTRPRAQSGPQAMVVHGVLPPRTTLPVLERTVHMAASAQGPIGGPPWVISRIRRNYHRLQWARTHPPTPWDTGCRSIPHSRWRSSSTQAQASITCSTSPRRSLRDIHNDPRIWE